MHICSLYIRYNKLTHTLSNYLTVCTHTHHVQWTHTHTQKNIWPMTSPLGVVQTLVLDLGGVGQERDDAVQEGLHSSVLQRRPHQHRGEGLLDACPPHSRLQHRQASLEWLQTVARSVADSAIDSSSSSYCCFSDPPSLISLSLFLLLQLLPSPPLGLFTTMASPPAYLSLLLLPPPLSPSVLLFFYYHHLLLLLSSLIVILL